MGPTYFRQGNFSKSNHFENHPNAMEIHALFGTANFWFSYSFWRNPKMRVFKTNTFWKSLEMIGKQTLSCSRNIGDSNTFEWFPRKCLFLRAEWKRNHTVSKVSNVDSENDTLSKMLDSDGAESSKVLKKCFSRDLADIIAICVP